MNLKIAYIFCLCSISFLACKSRQTLTSGDDLGTQNASANLRSSRQLKATFIEAKKEQIIGNKQKSRSLFQSVLERDPTCDACAYELAKIAISQNEAGLAVKMANKALELDPTNPYYKEQVAEIAYRTGDSKGAARISESIIDSFPKIRMHYKKTVFYYEKAREFEDAERILSRFEKQFGFTYQTAMMYDYLYDMTDNGANKVVNWSRLVKKYPNDIGYRKKHINALIEEAKYQDANLALNQLALKMDKPGYTYLLKSRISQIQKDWPNYILNISQAANDSFLDATLKTRYLVRSVEIKDSSILAPLRLIVNEDPAAEAFLNYYLKQFGYAVDQTRSLEAKYKADPTNQKLAEELVEALFAQRKFEKASKISLELVESNPSLVSYYHLYAKNLMAMGRFEDAYSYANQSLTYAISKDEICLSHVLQAQASFYMGKSVNVKDKLEKAWNNKGTGSEVIESLCYWSMLSGNFSGSLANELKTLESSYMSQLYALYTSDNYSIKAWSKLEELYKDNIRIIEAHLHKAARASEKKEAEILKARLISIFPSHSFYGNFKVE